MWSDDEVRRRLGNGRHRRRLRNRKLEGVFGLGFLNGERDRCMALFLENFEKKINLQTYFRLKIYILKFIWL